MACLVYQCFGTNWDVRCPAITCKYNDPCRRYSGGCMGAAARPPLAQQPSHPLLPHAGGFCGCCVGQSCSSVRPRTRHAALLPAMHLRCCRAPSQHAGGSCPAGWHRRPARQRSCHPQPCGHTRPCLWTPVRCPHQALASWAPAVCLLRRPALGVCVWCQSHRPLQPGGKECERWGEFPAGLPVSASLLANAAGRWLCFVQE